MTPEERGRSFRAYMDLVGSRLNHGAVEYGEASFERPILELITEIKEELADVAGWSWIMWHRLNRMAQVLQANNNLQNPQGGSPAKKE